MTSPVPFSSPPLAVTNPVMFTGKTIQIPAQIDYQEAPIEPPAKPHITWVHQTFDLVDLIDTWVKSPEKAPFDMHLEPSQEKIAEDKLAECGWTFTRGESVDGERHYRIFPLEKDQK